MRRDLDLVRKIALLIADSPGPKLKVLPDIEGVEHEIVVEHLELMKQAGLVNYVFFGGLIRREAMDLRLTWQGQEFVDATQDPDIWDRTKKASAKLGSFTLSTIGELAKGYIRSKAAELGLPL